MGRVKDQLMDVEDFVYSFYDKTGQLTATYPVIVKSAIEKFGKPFGEYAEDVLNGDSVYGPDYDYREEEMYFAQQQDEGIPF
jgi:hypothetical protein